MNQMGKLPVLRARDGVDRAPRQLAHHERVGGTAKLPGLKACDLARDRGFAVPRLDAANQTMGEAFQLGARCVLRQVQLHPKETGDDFVENAKPGVEARFARHRYGARQAFECHALVHGTNLNPALEKRG